MSKNDPPTEKPAEIDARIEFKMVEGAFITANIEAVDEPDNRAVVFVRFIGRHLQQLTDMAMREHKEVQQAMKSGEQVRSAIQVQTPRLVGPDSKPID